LNSTKQLPLSLICILAFGIALTPATYAVDGCSSVGFKNATSIFLDAPPFGIVSADFNGDGHLDLAVAPNSTSGEVIVLYGRGGTEKFGPPTNFPAGANARSVTAGDLNGDGKPDLIVDLDDFGQPTGRISILLNDGTGKFGAPGIISLTRDPGRPVLGDVNNDGKVDMVVGSSVGISSGRVAVLLGDGAGGFTNAANSPFITTSDNAPAVVIGDFNEDGKRDLALPGAQTGLDILLGDGTGAFVQGPHVTTDRGTLVLTMGDFNGDSHLDLLSDVNMLLGTGTGTFSAPINIASLGNSNAAFAGDVNNDGKLDLLAGGPGGLTVMLGDGTGNLVALKSYASGLTIFGASAFGALGDFNEDGKMDIAAAKTQGIGILDGDGTGAFNDAVTYTPSMSGMRDVVAADFNNDGKQDFAIIGPGFGFQFPAGSGVEVALGDGNGNFTKKSLTTFGTSTPTAVTTADFNNDGKLDLAVTNTSSGRVSILLNDGTGGFPTDGSTVPFVFVGFQPTAIKAADINNDSKVDLIVIRSQTNSYVVLLATGGGNFVDIGGAQVQGSSSFNDDLATGDFNSDGKVDIAVIRSNDSFVYVATGNGTSQFSSFASPAVPGTPVSVVVGDLNGDSKPDIAVSSSTFEGFLRLAHVTVMINNGAGFNSPTTYPSDGAGVLGIGDFNNDGKPDLAVNSGATVVGSSLDGISVLTNKGNGDFNSFVNYSAGPPSDHLAVADFNNDGKDDVLISQQGQSVALLLNNFTASQPCLSINDVTITEGDSGTTNAIFTVTMSAASAQTVKVNYFTSPAFLLSGASPATKGLDFESVPGTVTFLPGETTQTISIPIKGDLIDEFDQFFFVSLTTPINAEISDGRGLGTIVDNDAAPTISVNDVTIAEGTGGFQNQAAVFTVTLNGATEKPVSVQFALDPGTASAGTDYGNFTGLVQFFGPSQTITVQLVSDNVFEPDETFFVNLSNPTNATIGDGQGQATITNDDPQPTISIAASSFRTEGAAGTSGNASFEVRLSNPSYQTITVAYATANGTATAGSDYTATSGSITFNPGETTKTINVEVIGDNTDEVNETYFVNLTNPTNATLGLAQGVGTIADDDGPSMSIGNASVTEGNTGFTNAVFTVTLSAPSVQDITVNYASIGDTATANIDFQRVQFLTLFIPAGSTSATITIRVFGDFQIEPDEQFFVNLQFASNATIANGQGTGKIINDDSNGKLQFSSATYVATEDAGSFVVTVNRVDGATGTVNVDYATSNGTATAGSDYTATSGTFTFVQGEISKTISIPIVNDGVLEADETVNLTLSNPTAGATLGTPSTAVVTITTPPLVLVLDESGPGSHQATALDSLLLLRDPFPVVSTMTLLNPGVDHNTRVIVFVANLQLAPGDTASIVKVNLFDEGGQSYDVDAEDVRAVPFSNFMQVTFRLPDNLRAGVTAIKVRSRAQESNPGTIRIQ